VRSSRADWAFPGQAWVHCSLCPSWSARRKTCLRWTGACSCRWTRTWRRLGECLSAGSRSLSCVVRGRPIVHASLLPGSFALGTFLLLPAASSESAAQMLPILAQANSRMRLQRCETPLLPGPWVASLRQIRSAPMIAGVCTQQHHSLPFGASSGKCCAFSQQQPSCIAGGYSSRPTLAASRSQRQRRPEGGGWMEK
jgi:hypothetical protein